MIEIIQTNVFRDWLQGLRDKRAVARVQARLDRMAAGNPGDVKSVGEGVCEMRIDYGPGYRAYFIRRGALIVVLLCGGDKGAQAKDIEKAKVLAKEWKG